MKNLETVAVAGYGSEINCHFVFNKMLRLSEISNLYFIFTPF